MAAICGTLVERGDVQSPSIIGPMNSPPLSHPAVLVETPDQIRSLMEALKLQPRVAVDTESDSLYAYPEKVCLIQFSFPAADFLLDPLAFEDLGVLGPFFSNPKVEKVLHGAEYDVAVLKRDFGFSIINLFDTRVAARTLGVRHNSLEALLSQFLELDLDKRYQRANWGKRPLPADMLDYARLDTHFLLPLRDRLMERLNSLGRLEEALEACEYLAGLEPHDHTFDPQGFWRINGAQHLPGQQLAVLRELYLLREQMARRLDRPPFKVLGDRTLLAISQATPRGFDDLRTLPGMTERQLKRYGDEILRAVVRGRRSPTPRRPQHHRPDEAVVERYERLRRWRKREARERQVDSDIILPREMLWDIAYRTPKTRKQLGELLHPLHLRAERYGDEILAVIGA
jgi:ribonuclease D